MRKGRALLLYEAPQEGHGDEAEEDDEEHGPADHALRLGAARKGRPAVSRDVAGRAGPGGHRYSHGPPGDFVQVLAEEARRQEMLFEGRDQRERGHETQQRPPDVDEERRGGTRRHGRAGRCPDGRGAAPGGSGRPDAGAERTGYARAFSIRSVRAAPSLALAAAAPPVPPSHGASSFLPAP